MHKRILQHLRGITNADPTYSVARHLNEHHSNNPNCLKYFVIDAVPKLRQGGNQEWMLTQWETRYTLNLDSKSPNSLNVGEDLCTFL